MTKVNKDKIKQHLAEAKGKRLDITLLLPTKLKKKLTDKVTRKA